MITMRLCSRETGKEYVWSACSSPGDRGRVDPRLLTPGPCQGGHHHLALARPGLGIQKRSTFQATLKKRIHPVGGSGYGKA